MVVTLTGNNAYLLRNKLRQLVNDFVQKNGDLALEKHDGDQLEPVQLIEAVQSLPFLSPKRMVVVDELSKNKPAIEQIDTILDAVTDTTDFILIEPKPDKRTVYYKTLQKRTNVQLFNELDNRGLAEWIASEAKQRGGKISSSDALYLVSRLGPNQLALSNELDKLITYNPMLTKEVINLLTEPNPQSSIFDLIEAAISGDTNKALHLYDEQRMLKVESQQIIALMTWQLHILAIIKTAGQKSDSDIAREAHLNPFVVRKSAGLARQLSFAYIKRNITSLAELDARSKTIGIDPDEALKNYLLELA